MGLISVFKKIFRGKEEELCDDLDESAIPEELRSFMENMKDEETMKHSSIRHQAEQDVLPHIFFKETKMFLEDMDRVKEGLIQEVLSVPYFDMGEESPYSIDDFKVTKEQLNLDMSMIKLEMPKKNMFMGNCHRIYFLFDNKLKKRQYFTVEESIGTKQLCAIDRKGKRMNYGKVQLESQETEKIISLIR